MMSRQTLLAATFLLTSSLAAPAAAESLPATGRISFDASTCTMMAIGEGEEPAGAGQIMSTCKLGQAVTEVAWGEVVGALGYTVDFLAWGGEEWVAQFQLQVLGSEVEFDFSGLGILGAVSVTAIGPEGPGTPSALVVVVLDETAPGDGADGATSNKPSEDAVGASQEDPVETEYSESELTSLQSELTSTMVELAATVADADAAAAEVAALTAANAALEADVELLGAAVGQVEGENAALQLENARLLQQLQGLQGSSAPAIPSRGGARR